MGDKKAYYYDFDSVRVEQARDSYPPSSDPYTHQYPPQSYSHRTKGSRDGVGHQHAFSQDSHNQHFSQDSQGYRSQDGHGGGLVRYQSDDRHYPYTTHAGPPDAYPYMTHASQLGHELTDQKYPYPDSPPDKYPGNDDEEGNGLKRKLRPRHISLLSIGGIIGTGLFLGNALVSGGPVGLFLGYAIYGFVLICVMQGLGEMTSYMPITGGHMMYAGRFVDPALAFAVNWAYAIEWMLVTPAELAAVAVLFNYWIPSTQVSNAVWIVMGWVVVTVLNLFPASVYGEVEFIFSSIKVITIIGLIICGICINVGAGPTGEYLGFRYWVNPGPFGKNYLDMGDNPLSRFLGFWAVLTQAAYSYFGSEIVAVAAAESKNPARTIPRAIRQVYFRIILFYVLGTFIIGITCPSNDPALGTAKDASASPFVIAISRAGIKILPHIINGALITSAWSAANADIYIGSRSLFSLANQGYLPQFFLYTTSKGAPIVASIVTSLSGLLAFMVVSTDANRVFNWFVSLTASGGLMIYIGISITYIRFRQALDHQGIDRNILPFRSGFARAGAWFSLCFITVVAFFAAWSVFYDTKNFDAAKFITTYLPVIGVPLLYVCRKLYAKTSIIPLDEIDVHTGARHRDQFEPDEENQGLVETVRSWIF